MFILDIHGTEQHAFLEHLLLSSFFLIFKISRQHRDKGKSSLLGWLSLLKQQLDLEPKDSAPIPVPSLKCLGDVHKSLLSKSQFLFFSTMRCECETKDV